MYDDPGSEVYTRRTFSSERYDSKILSSYGHPVPVVGGSLQRTGGKFAAKVYAADADRVTLDLPVAWNVRPEVKAQGGSWRLVEETIPNPGRWAPHRVAVRFDQPVKTADVMFVYKNENGCGIGR